jgi:hypothetical protein
MSLQKSFFVKYAARVETSIIHKSRHAVKNVSRLYDKRKKARMKAGKKERKEGRKRDTKKERKKERGCCPSLLFSLQRRPIKSSMQ